MSTERLPDGPDLEAMIQLIRDAFPDAVVARIESAAYFSLDEKHWPNFATIVWTDEHDEGAPSNLARPGVYRVNVGVERETFQRLVGSLGSPRATIDWLPDGSARRRPAGEPRHARAGLTSPASRHHRIYRY